MAYRIRSKESGTKALRRIAAEQLERASASLVTLDQSAESRHELRLRLKRLRALAALVGDECRAVQRLNCQVRAVSHAIEAQREVDALKRIADQVCADLPSRIRKRAAAVLQRVIGRSSGVSNAGATADPTANASRLKKCSRAAGALHVEHDRSIPAAIGSSYRAARKAWRAAVEKPSDRRRHELRKRAKNLGYQLRLIGDACRPMLDAQIGQLRSLAESLGDERDLSILEAALTDSPERQRASCLHAQCLQQIHRLRKKHLGDAVLVAAGMFAEKPRAFAARINAYWYAWRTSR